MAHVVRHCSLPRWRRIPTGDVLVAENGRLPCSIASAIRSAAKLSTALDTSSRSQLSYLVTAKDLRRILRSFGCVEIRQRGSHLRIECGQCVTTVPVHAGEDIGPGLLRRIERDLEPCLGKGWLKKP
jgi:predicted RNA binding protein YcfA (HicA-like mRNA interferase family)